MCSIATHEGTFPLQSAQDPSYNGSTDAFISKLNASGSALLYSTYLGGSATDKGNAIAVDTSGNVIVTGETRSNNFPMQSAFDSSFGGGGCAGDPCEDVFVTKLNASGSALVYSTYLGGNKADEGEGVALDSSGKVYVTGATGGGLTTSVGAYDSSYNGGATDAFLTKLDPSLSGSSSHLYTTYLGGSDDEQGNAITVDSGNKAYIAGETYSSGFPTLNAYDSSQNGASDVFVSKLNPSASGAASLLYSTFLGGSSYDKGLGSTVDSAGSYAYVTGYSQSDGFPTLNAWQASRNGDKDIILAQLNPAASGSASLLYSTFMGGSDEDRGLAIARDSSGALALTGLTRSTDLAVVNAIQPSLGGGICGTITCTDAFVTLFDLTQNTPLYQTYLGGNSDDEGHGIAMDTSGAAYVTGFTASPNFPTASPRQGTSGGGSDAFIAKLTLPTVALSTAALTVSEAIGTAVLTVTLSASSAQTVTVGYTTSNGSASAGSDYTARSGTLVFAPGQTSQTVTVPIANDPNDEPTETFSFTLANPDNARLGTPSSTTVTITDNDAPPTVAWQSATFSDAEDAGPALVTVQLSVASGFTVTVAYATSNGTATAPADYTAASGTLTFAPGETSKHLNIITVDDAVQEGDETVTLTLSSPSNASLGTPNPATLTILDDETPEAFDEVYRYNKIGNLIFKTGLGAYSYGASASGCTTGTPATKPHAVTSAHGVSYAYDCNGNLTSAGGQLTTWDAENRPTSLSRTSGSETYSYDADGERLTRTHGYTTTVSLGGLWEEDVVSGTTALTRTLYLFNEAVVAQRSGSSAPISLHGDHLGSISVATVKSGGQAVVVSTQTFDPWGQVRSGGIGQTDLNYTGQRLDMTELLYYHARMYDPVLVRFASADSISPDYEDPQTRNRYSYVLNNPLKYTDPTGHCAAGDGDDPVACQSAQAALESYAINLDDLANWKLAELNLVMQGVVDFRTAAGWSIDDFKSAMGGGVSLVRGGNNPDASGYQAGHTVTLYDQAFGSGDEWAKRTVVHEFAHQWDAVSPNFGGIPGGSLSNGFVEATGGTINGICVDFGPAGIGGCIGTYQPGDAANRPQPSEPHYSENKHEDFAESVAATVYSSSSMNNPKYKGSKRNLYVQAQFAKYKN